jgi:hypothetical protein
MTEEGYGGKRFPPRASSARRTLEVRTQVRLWDGLRQPHARPPLREILKLTLKKQSNCSKLCWVLRSLNPTYKIVLISFHFSQFNHISSRFDSAKVLATFKAVSKFTKILAE